jgi:hypothetical protein
LYDFGTDAQNHGANEKGDLEVTAAVGLKDPIEAKLRIVSIPIYNTYAAGMRIL